MRKLILSFIALCFLSTGAFALDKCIFASKEEFMANVQRQIVKTYMLTPEQLTMVLERWNTARKAKNVPIIEADEMLVAKLQKDRYGIVLFREGCMVPGTALAGNKEAMVAIFTAMGLTPEEFNKFLITYKILDA